MYRLSGGTGDYDTLNILDTSVTLQNLVRNAAYDVAVAAINSNGVSSNFSAMSQFTVTPPTAAQQSEIPYHSHLHAVIVYFGVALYQAIK